MPTRHTCKTNDHIGKIAAEYGFRNWQTVWDANKSRLRRDDPSVLYKGRSRTGNGDYLDIPTRAETPEARGIDAEHVFEATAAGLFLRVRIFKDDFTPLKNADYELTVVGVPAPFKGKTNDQGVIEHPIPPATQQAKLTVRVKAEDSDTAPPPGGDPPPADGAEPAPVRGDAPVTWTLEIGGLNPIKESAPDEYCISGVQQRLNNLNFNTGPIDGILGPNTRAAIGAFQDLFRISGGSVQRGVPDASWSQVTLFDLHDGPTPPAVPTSDGPPPVPPR